MRRWSFCAPMIALCLLLTGCGRGEGPAEDPAQTIRTEYSALASCTGIAEITADYGQRVYDFTLDFSVADGETTLTITAPEEVAGVTARIAAGETRLEYDGVMLETGLLSRGRAIPGQRAASYAAAMPAAVSATNGARKRQRRKRCSGWTIAMRRRHRAAGQRQACGSIQRGMGWPRGELMVDGYRVITCVFTEFAMTPALAD